MLTFGEKLKQARISKKLTQKQLSDKLDVSNTVISKWEKNINRPDVDILEVMCGILDIEPNSLFNVKNNDNSTYSLVEKKLVSDYRKLDDHSKEVVQVVIRKELERNIPNEPNYNNIIPIKKYQVPYYDMPVSAGTGNPLDEEYPEKIDLVEQPPKGTDFIVRVSGDSMEPTYHNGDKLFVKEQPSIEVGDIGIFVVNGNAYVKELGIDKLISHNEKYPDIIINEYITSKCCGKVLGICEEKIWFNIFKGA